MINDIKKIQWKTLLISIAIPLIIGLISFLLSGDVASQYGAMEKPTLSPPASVFPIVWTMLYILMGISSYLVVASECDSENKESAVSIYSAQLFFNFFWTILFFKFQLYFFSFLWLMVLWILIVITIMKFYKCVPPAGYLLIPYLVWVTFAAYLNLATALLN